MTTITSNIKVTVKIVKMYMYMHMHVLARFPPVFVSNDHNTAKIITKPADLRQICFMDYELTAD